MTTRALRPSSATAMLRRSPAASSRRPRATSTALIVRAEYRPDEQEEEEVPAAARIFATGVGFMLNAAGFAACYELSPSMRILAGVIEETQDPGEEVLEGEAGGRRGGGAPPFLSFLSFSLFPNTTKTP